MAFLPPTPAPVKRQAGIAKARQRHAHALDKVVGNVDSCLSRATPEAWREGLPWYFIGHEAIRALALRHDTPLETAIGVAAILSPSTTWAQNLTLLDQQLATGDCSHMYGNAEQARQIQAGATLRQVLRGPARKVRNFDSCLSEPDRPGPVCVDRHAVTMATGLTLAQAKPVLENLGTYQLVAAGFRTVAARHGLLPSQVQAVTWIQHRLETGVQDTADPDYVALGLLPAVHRGIARAAAL